MKPVLIGLVRFYQIVLSRPLHWLGGPGAGCRFTPTCSQFFLEAVRVHGAGRGTWLGVRRLLRCHPWGGHGCDPVPPAPASPREDSGCLRPSPLRSGSSLSPTHQPPTHRPPTHRPPTHQPPTHQPPAHEHLEVRRDALTSLPPHREAV